MMVVLDQLQQGQLKLLCNIFQPELKSEDNLEPVETLGELVSYDFNLPLQKSD